MNVLFAGGLECWRQRSLRYAQDYKRNYFNDLIELHDSLGLSVRLGGAVAMASLVGCNSVTSFLLWPPCVADADIIFLPCDFFLSSVFLSIFFIPRLISAAADWMPTILPHMVWP